MPKRRSGAPFIIAGMAVLALIVGALVFIQKEDTDPNTNCPMFGHYMTTIVVIDTSDPLSSTQKRSFDKFVDTLIKPPRPNVVVTVNSDIANYVGKGDLLAAYEIMPNENANPRLLFKMCNPGDPDGRSFLDALTEGKMVAQLKWNEFKNRLLDAFPEDFLDQKSPTSPIIETLKYVRSAEFPTPADLKSSGQRAGSIFIISDMLQNSKNLSHFGDLPSVTGVPSQFALDLTGIDIGIRYLKVHRYAHLQYGTRPHFKWWREFFAEAGAPLNKSPDVW